MALLDKCKNLDKNGAIVFAVPATKHRISDITHKLQVLRSYRLQYQTFGYVVVGGAVVYERRALTANIHRRINKGLAHYGLLCNTNYMNSIALCSRVVKNKDLKGFRRLLRASSYSPVILKRWGITEKFFM